jgi:hypothetical protein
MVFEEIVGDEVRKVVVSRKGVSFLFERNGQQSFMSKIDAVGHLVQSCLDADQEYPLASETLRSRHRHQLEMVYARLLDMIV